MFCIYVEKLFIFIEGYKIDFNLLFLRMKLTIIKYPTGYLIIVN